MSEQIFLLQGQYFNDDEWHTVLENKDRDYLELRQSGDAFYAPMLGEIWHRSRIVSKEDYLLEQEEIKKLKEFDKLTKDTNDLSDEQITFFRKQVGL